MNAVIVLSQAEIWTYVVLGLGSIGLLVWKRNKLIDRVVGSIDHSPTWDGEEE